LACLAIVTKNGGHQGVEIRRLRKNLLRYVGLRPDATAVLGGCASGFVAAAWFGELRSGHKSSKTEV
jgi:hypothetical protein